MNIILIDDSRIILKIAEDIIHGGVQYNNLRAFTKPKKAMMYIRNHPVDLVLTDLVMPEMSGKDIITTIKQDAQLKHIKILMVTSINDYNMLAECFELGASDYITKPFDEYEFLARVKNAIREINLSRALAVQLKRVKEEQEELTEANRRLKITQAQLVQKEKMAGIGQLAAGVAHEINNPLGFILSNFDTLKEYMFFIKELVNRYENLNIEDEPIKTFKKENDYEFILEDIFEIINDTNDGLQRVKEIIKSLRHFSHIDVFKEYVPYNVNDGIKETLIIAKNEYKYVATVETDLDELPEIKAYGGEINQVILNMVINSVHAIKEKGNEGLIKIKTEDLQNEEAVKITIEDNGIGMEPDTVSEIFNPFFTTKEVGVGTGLGLSITYDIITNKHKGTIDVHSQKGVGTTFEITLPYEQS